MTNLPDGYTDPPPPDSAGEWSKKGQSFNYAKNVILPGKLGEVSSNPFSLVTTLRDNVDYAVSSLMKGYDCRRKNLMLGNRFFVKSGVCDRKRSHPQCQGKTRYLFIDNVPSRVMPCIDTTQPYDKNCDKGGTGLAVGMIQDIVKLNPFELISSSLGKGSIVNDVCVPRTEYVGYIAGGSKGVCSGKSASCSAATTKDDCRGDNGCTWHPSKFEKNLRLETRCSAKKQPLVCSLKFSGNNCHVYSKTYMGERVDNFGAAEHRGVPIPASDYSHTGTDGDLFTTLVAHCQKKVDAIAQNNWQPENYLLWVEVGTTRNAKSFYALHFRGSESACAIPASAEGYVSDIGVQLTDGTTFQVFQNSFKPLLSCQKAGTCTGAIVSDLRQKCTAVLLNAQSDMLQHEHSNITMNAFLQRVVAKHALENAPLEKKVLGSSKYDRMWRSTVTGPVQYNPRTNTERFGGTHEILNRLWRMEKPRDEFILKNACCKRIVECTNNYRMFEWISTIYRPNRTYGFQVLWRAYRNLVRTPQKMFITDAKVIGNPTAIDIPRTVPMDKKWLSVEGFRSGGDPREAPETSKARFGVGRLLLLLVLLLLLLFVSRSKRRRITTLLPACAIVIIACAAAMVSITM